MPAREKLSRELLLAGESLGRKAGPPGVNTTNALFPCVGRWRRCWGGDGGGG